MHIGQEKLVTLVKRLVQGELVLPDIQREFVWSGSKIPRLLDSLYKQWPTGSILLWTTSLDIPIKDAAVTQGTPVGVKPTYLLDGQQRITTLARVMAPQCVPEGQRAPDIRYHPGREEFATANAVQAKDPAWISVSALLAEGAQFFDLLREVELAEPERTAWYEKLSAVAQRIREYPIPVQSVSEDDYERVAEIFQRVNTGGRRLSKGDLIMGILAARWPAIQEGDGTPAVPGGRAQIESFEEQVAARGWDLNREVILRVMSVLALRSPNHPRLLELKTAAEWQDAWTKTEEAIKRALDFLRQDAGIPMRSLLPTEYVLLVPAAFLHRTGGVFASPEERDQLRRWIYLASAFGHYSGSVETRLAQDVALIYSDDRGSILPALVQSAQEPRTPETKLTGADLRGKTIRSPFNHLLQLAALHNDAKTWWSHHSIAHDPESKGLAIERHHIFPRNWLKRNGLQGHPDTDTLANLAFLSKHDNIRISDEDPASYLAGADQGELEGQWVPTDSALWTPDRFEDFIEARCDLLAEALNDLLGLQSAPAGEEPLAADEAPEPAIGAWAEGETQIVAA